MKNLILPGLSELIKQNEATTHKPVYKAPFSNCFIAAQVPVILRNARVLWNVATFLLTQLCLQIILHKKNHFTNRLRQIVKEIVITQHPLCWSTYHGLLTPGWSEAWSIFCPVLSGSWTFAWLCVCHQFPQQLTNGGADVSATNGSKKQLLKNMHSINQNYVGWV